MKTISILPETMQFLQELAENNNRNWFQANKERFITAQENMIGFIDQLLLHMKQHDTLENEPGKNNLYRIYRDVRFGKDKTPYSPRFAFGFKRASKLRRGGYYMQIQPGNSYLACGFFAPNKEDLFRIRKDMEANEADWNKLLKQKTIKTNFGGLKGKTLTTAPRGFAKDDRAIGLIRHQQLYLQHHFTDQEVISKDFCKQVNGLFRSVRPFFDYMSDVLTSNLNGERIA
jgi:uncharacterized protein (TIGR02453 family)